MKWFRQLIDFLRFALTDKEPIRPQPEIKKDEGNHLANIIDSIEEPAVPGNSFPDVLQKRLNKPVQRVMPIIDAGHGGIHPKTHEYTTAPAKMHDHGFMIFYEGVFNRKVSDHFKRLLRNAGYEYATIYHEFEDWKLSKRAKLANEITKAERAKKRDCLLFSIHGNAFCDPDANGFEVFSYLKASDKSKQSCEVIVQQAAKLLPELKMRGHKSANFAILRETNCPANLSEFGFFTNPDEARLMVQEQFQARCAQVLFNTFLHFNGKTHV